MLIDVKDLYKIYNEGKESEVRALDGVTLSIDRGEFVAIIGASGSGKSTLMNILGCLDIPTYGDYILNGTHINDRSDRQLAHIRNKEIGFIFQGYNLIPALTAYENVELPLIYQGVSIFQREERVMEALKKVGMDSRWKHKPAEMSGGQQQRVAIARALVKMPRVLLLDEPLSNLDARLRLQTREEICKIQKKTGITTLFVTHDQEEAMSISDRIVVMKDGILMQQGAPQQVYDDPANLFVAKFLGTPPINVFEGEVRTGRLLLAGQDVLPVPGAPDGAVWVGIRPEGFVPDAAGPVVCGLSRVEVLGRDVSIVCTHPACTADTLRAIVNARQDVDGAADTVRFALHPDKVFLFARDTEARIRFDVQV